MTLDLGRRAVLRADGNAGPAVEVLADAVVTGSPTRATFVRGMCSTPLGVTAVGTAAGANLVEQWSSRTSFHGSAPEAGWATGRRQVMHDL